jgi:hypothetical protein
METALFAWAGPDEVVPGPLTAGPWDPGHCHGGAPGALVAHLADSVVAPVPMTTVRCTIDLLRPVPRQRLRTVVTVVREGRRVQRVAVELQDVDGDALVRCAALRIRTTALDLPEGLSSLEPLDAAAPDELTRYEGGPEWPAGFFEALELRLPDGRIGQRGPTAAWTRLRVPVLPDTPILPLSRVAAAADFGNGISSPLPMGSFLFINPDLTIDVHRPPDGPWVGLWASTAVEPRGTGLTTSRLYDPAGRIGTALQSLYVDRMD